MKEIVITSTALILCVMLIRHFFKGKISSRLQYALWILVAVRLMMPVSAQISLSLGAVNELRVMELAERLEEKIGDITGRPGQPATFALYLDSSVGSRAAEYVLGEEISGTVTADGATSVFLAGKTGTWADLLRGIWVGGMGIMAVWMIAVNFRFRRKLHKERCEFPVPERVSEQLHRKLSGIFIGDGADEISKAGQKAASNEETAAAKTGRERMPGKLWNGIHRKLPSCSACRLAGRMAIHAMKVSDFHSKKQQVRVYTVEHLMSPCLYGLPGREAIYLPENITEDETKLRHVLTHEICHKRHGDGIWSLLRSVLLVFYWFHPLVWAAAILSKRDCELACDESVLILLGEQERIGYGKTLLSIISGKGKLSDVACTATTMTGSGKSVRERVHCIAGKPKVLGTAVAAVVLLITAASVLVFTESPRFSGGIWDNGTVYVMTADKRIMLPDTIAGISGYAEVKGNKNDLIIYQTASDQEVGRFCTVTYEEAVALVDAGRTVVPLGDYGKNIDLKQYMGLFSHVYTPAERVTEQEGGLLPAEEFITDGLIQEDAEGGTEHEYTAPNPSDKAPFAFDGKTEWEYDESNPSAKKPFAFDGQSEWRNQEEPERVTESPEAGVPGTDSNADITTYMIEDSAEGQDHTVEENATDYIPEEAVEGSTVYHSDEYLPEEQITTIAIPVPYFTDCYIYVTADHSGVKDKYLEEMAYIDGELRNAAGQTIVTGINRELTEETFDILAEHKTRYLGDNSAVLALVNALPQPEGLSYQKIELHTGGEPETMALQVCYNLRDDSQTYIDRDVLRFNAVMLFATIENLEQCSFRVEAAEGGLIEDLMCSREEMTEWTGVERLWTEQEGEELQAWLEELHQRVIAALYER